MSSDNILKFKSQASAVEYLTEIGFKTSTSSFSRAVIDKLINSNSDGHFEEPDLVTYAQIYLEPLRIVRDEAIIESAGKQKDARARLQEIQAKRQELAYKKELGEVVPKELYEQALATRAAFLRREIEIFAHLHASQLINIVDGDENKLKEFVEFYEDKAKDMMHAWSLNRSYGSELDTMLIEETTLQ